MVTLLYMADVVYHTSNTYYPSHFVARVINAVIGVIEALLAVRLVLDLFAASPSAPFIAWLYNVTDGLVAPFAGAFPALAFGGFLIDFSVILAMIVYAILGWIIIYVLSFIFDSFARAV